MKKNYQIKILIMIVTALFLFTSLSPAQELFKTNNNDVNISNQQISFQSKSNEYIIGERIVSTETDSGYIENMDECIARDLIQRSKLDLDPKDDKEHQGIWVIPSRGAIYFPYSGKLNVINKWGDTKMGIKFPYIVDVHGAWFAGQGGGEAVYTSRIRVLGFNNGEHTETTDWFNDIDETPSWFAINLQNVDRIVIEAAPVFKGAGWYGMDDFTFTPKVNDRRDRVKTIVLDFEECSYKQNLNITNYAGLTWEIGTGGSLRGENERNKPEKKSELEDKPSLKKQLRINRASTPTLLNDFQGVIRGDADHWSYPPDSCGAVGPNHYVETVNRNFAVYNKTTGEELINMLLTSFLPGSNGDPRVLYDQYSDRWFVINCDFESKLYLAVSLSDDPTGDWFKCSFTVSQGSDAGKWPDYPTLGVDEVGVYTAAYMIGGSNGMSIFALDKAPLIASEPYLGDVYAFRELPWEGAIQPVHTFGSTDGEYFVSRMSGTSLRVRLLTDLLSTPILNEFCSIIIPSHSSPPDAPALGSNVPLDTVGHRLMNAVYRDGFIWTAHCIGLGGRAASRWYKIDVNNITLDDYGTIEDSVMYYYFPTIMVNGNGDAIMGFSGSSPDQYAAAYYTGRRINDPPGEMCDPVLLKEGEATYNLIDGYGRNRWGDYSLCSIDPIKHTLWTIQEYAHSHNESGENRWGTWIGELAYNLPPDKPENLNGPDEGITGIEYTFYASTTDPEEDQIYYKFDWGDGTDSGWIGPYESGQEVLTSHIWETPGDFSVMVKAKDDFGESDWSNEHVISIIAGPKLEIGLITGGLFKVKTSIKNIGGIAANNISWKISFDGGAFIGKETTGSITCMPVDSEQTINSDFVFGFGPTIVNVTSEISEGTDIRDQTGFIFLFFIQVNPGG